VLDATKLDTDEAVEESATTVPPPIVLPTAYEVPETGSELRDAEVLRTTRYPPVGGVVAAVILTLILELVSPLKDIEAGANGAVHAPVDAVTLRV
jgi:hypothetical protein